MSKEEAKYPVPPEGCSCASFFTLRHKHKKDCIWDPPICHGCDKPMKPYYDTIAKKYTGYSWMCECAPNMILSRG